MWRKKKILSLHSEQHLKSKHRPTIIEFMIDPEDLVYPMIKPGGTLEELIMDC